MRPEPFTLRLGPDREGMCLVELAHCFGTDHQIDTAMAALDAAPSEWRMWWVESFGNSGLSATFNGAYYELVNRHRDRVALYEDGYVIALGNVLPT